MRRYNREYSKTPAQRERRAAYYKKKYAEDSTFREQRIAAAKKWKETHPKEYAVRMLAHYKKCVEYWAGVVAAFSADTKGV